MDILNPMWYNDKKFDFSESFSSLLYVENHVGQVRIMTDINTEHTVEVA